MRRVFLGISTFFVAGAMGCVVEYHGGAQIAGQTGGPVTQSIAVGAGGAFGDGDGALGETVEGAIGVDERSRRVAGTTVAGLEYSSYGGEPREANRYAVLAGADWTGEEKSAAILVLLRYGHAWVVDFDESSSNRGVTSISLDPTIGIAVPAEDDSRRSFGVFLGLGVTFRHENFSEWRFHF